MQTAFKNHSPLAVPYRTALAWNEELEWKNKIYGVMVFTSRTTSTQHAANCCVGSWVNLQDGSEKV